MSARRPTRKRIPVAGSKPNQGQGWRTEGRVQTAWSPSAAGSGTDSAGSLSLPIKHTDLHTDRRTCAGSDRGARNTLTLVPTSSFLGNRAKELHVQRLCSRPQGGHNSQSGICRLLLLLLLLLLFLWQCLPKADSVIYSAF